MRKGTGEWEKEKMGKAGNIMEKRKGKRRQIWTQIDSWATGASQLPPAERWPESKITATNMKRKTTTYTLNMKS